MIINAQRTLLPMALEKAENVDLFLLLSNLYTVPEVVAHLTASEPALNQDSSLMFLLPVLLSLTVRNRMNFNSICMENIIVIFNQLD